MFVTLGAVLRRNPTGGSVITGQWVRGPLGVRLACLGQTARSLVGQIQSWPFGDDAGISWVSRTKRRPG